MKYCRNGVVWNDELERKLYTEEEIAQNNVWAAKEIAKINGTNAWLIKEVERSMNMSVAEKAKERANQYHNKYGKDKLKEAVRKEYLPYILRHIAEASVEGEYSFTYSFASGTHLDTIGMIQDMLEAPEYGFKTHCCRDECHNNVLVINW